MKLRHLLPFTSVLALSLGACSVTPEPLTSDEINQRIKTDRAVLFADQSPISGPITLPEAIARAVKYNLDHRLRLMETAIAQGDTEASRWDLLPRLAANAGYTMRNNEGGAKSKSLLTGRDSLEYSTSAEKIYPTAGLQTAWNVLDFGVSWLRSKQMADNVLLTEELRRKMVQGIVQDVRYAFFRAASAQRLMPKVEALKAQVARALEDSRAGESRGLEAPERALEYQQTLLETMREINSVQRDLVLARTELAMLMNVPTVTEFRVADPGTLAVPGVPRDLRRLQDLALANRPELREQDYKRRISAAEVDKTWLRLLPGLELSADLQYSGNKYLFNESWAEGGVKLTWNLMNLLSAPERLKMAEAREDFEVRKRQAVSVAVLAQVNVAWLRREQSLEDYRLAQELLDVSTRLEQRTANAAAASAGTEQDMIRRSARGVFFELRRDLAYAELQNASGRMYSTIGADPLPRRLLDADLPTVSAEIAHALAAWDEGRMDLSLQAEPTQVVPASAPPMREQSPKQAPEADDNQPSALERWFSQGLDKSANPS